MTHADIVRVFSYSPISAEQEQDLCELHEAAEKLATTIYRVVTPNAAQNAIAQLTGIVSMCRTAIEINPRQSANERIKLVTQ